MLDYIFVRIDFDLKCYVFLSISVIFALKLEEVMFCAMGIFYVLWFKQKNSSTD